MDENCEYLENFRECGQKATFGVRHGPIWHRHDHIIYRLCEKHTALRFHGRSPDIRKLDSGEDVHTDTRPTHGRG